MVPLSQRLSCHQIALRPVGESPLFDAYLMFPNVFGKCLDISTFSVTIKTSSNCFQVEIWDLG